MPLEKEYLDVSPEQEISSKYSILNITNHLRQNIFIVQGSDFTYQFRDKRILYLAVLCSSFASKTGKSIFDNNETTFSGYLNCFN